MFTIDTYLPTKIVFGAGRLEKLATEPMPGKKALICAKLSKRAESQELLERVCGLLKKNGTDYAVFSEIEANPTKSSVEKGVAVAKKENCDFVLGLGGGSSIDCAKAVAIMMKSSGDLWDYGYTGTGGQREVEDALPVVTVSTTCGTGTESDQYCVITNEETGEKLDFTANQIFPKVSFIDPELMLSLPKNFTIFQGFDGLFHAEECYVCNGHANRMVDLYAKESVHTVNTWLPKVLENPDDVESRSELAYACDILSGYTMGLVSVTSHHILGQSIGGLFPNMPHGATLIAVAEAYYKKVCGFVPDVFDEMGELMGVKADPEKPGYAFVTALQNLMDVTGCRKLSLSDYGITEKDFPAIVDMTVDQVGISLDRYTLTKEDMMDILRDSLTK